MDFQDAIRKIEERGDFNRYAELKPVFQDKLESLKPGDHTERGLCYYYLLVSYLKAHLVHETAEAVEYYEKMDAAFKKQEKIYKEDKKKIYNSEIADFFKLMERCYGSLELLYGKKHFLARREDAFIRKMQYRKKMYSFKRRYWKWFEYIFLELTSNFGTSITRWALTTFGFALVMSFAYFAMDAYTQEAYRIVGSDGHWFDYVYFALITLTSVGYGDFVPIILEAKILTVIESFFGFLMLGIFIGLIHKKQ